VASGRKSLNEWRARRPKCDDGYLDQLQSHELIADVCLPRNSAQVGKHARGVAISRLGRRRAQKQMSSEADALFVAVMAEISRVASELGWSSIGPNSRGNRRY
jgi:hypothetical protein